MQNDRFGHFSWAKQPIERPACVGIYTIKAAFCPKYSYPVMIFEKFGIDNTGISAIILRIRTVVSH
jgi:hypothetical protein